MDHNTEYHDPDYPEAPVCVKEEPPSLSEDEKVEKIQSIIRREISNELEVRESEVMLIDQRMSTSRRLLHRLRYALVTRYYSDQKLHLGNGQIQDEIAAQRDPRARADVANQLRDGQRQLHPSVRKLLGKKTVDIDEIFRTRGPRNKTRRDYSAMIQKRNYTISADSTKSLRPERGEELMDPKSPGGPGEPGGSLTQPRKVPRHLDPKITNVVTLDEATRNKMKHRYRIVIGNTSKYVPPASRADRSTHKWLLYIRGPPETGDLSRLVTAVTVTLHHSYAPHHIVHLDKPPYHISRRGWGEFPATIELHFPLPHRNRPATLQHNIKLDRNYTGLQMLGSETVVDVWLYSTQEMLQYEYKETDVQTNEQTDTQMDEQTNEQTDVIPEIKTEGNCEAVDDSWMDFFTKAPTELDVDEMIIKPVKKEKIEEIKIEKEPIEETPTEILITDTIKQEFIEPETDQQYHESTNILEVPHEILKQPPSVKKRIVKYIDPTTGKIYYLEMDRELDLSKVQEIIINNTTTKISPIKSNGLKSVRKKKGVSLLKPEIKSLLKSESVKEKVKPDLSHIENDHCYISTPKMNSLSSRVNENVASDVEIKREKNLFTCLCSVMRRFSTVRAAVNYLVKKIPLISDEVRDPDFMKHFPFVVESCDKYWKLDFAKRRNIEWSRAKLINRILTEHFRHSETIWRTKQILLYIRMHGHYPIRNEFVPVQPENMEWSSWNELETLRQQESNIRETYPNARDINTLTQFHFHLDRSTNESYEISDDEDVDIVNTDVRPEVKREPPEVSSLEVLPVDREEDRLRFMFVERKCQDIGIELRNEDVGNGCSYSAVHAVLLSAMKSFAEELIRSALAAKRRQDNPQAGPSVWNGCPSSKTTISLREVYSGSESSRLRVMTSRDIATSRKHTHAI